MHPELEKLIELAVVDGKLTDKEREVLQRKARELNDDLDELDMVLDAKLFIQNRDSEVIQTPEQITETGLKHNIIEEKNIKISKFFNEDYKEYLRKIICKDKLLFILNSRKYIPNYSMMRIYFSEDELKIIEGIDSIKFLNENVSVITYVINAEFLLVIRLEELLYHKLFNDIDYIFKQLAKEELEKDNIYIVKSYLDGAKKKSRYELEKLITRSTSEQLDLIFGAYCFSSLFNDFIQARNCLEKVLNVEEGAGHTKIFELVEAWKLLFNEENEVRRGLMVCENKLQDLIECAFMWKEFFDDDREVKRCIKLEEEKEKVSWADCTLAWKLLLNDDDNSRRCVLEREKYLGKIKLLSKLFDALGWIEIAMDWKIILNDDINTKRCLEKAKNVATEDVGDEKTKAEYCTKYWKLLLNDDNSTIKTNL